MLSYANESNMPHHEFSVPKQPSDMLLSDKQSQLMPEWRDDQFKHKAGTILSLHPNADAQLYQDLRLSQHSLGKESDLLPGSFSSN